MRINIIDNRLLGVGVFLGPDQWWNWTTKVFETPFNATNHITPFVPAESAPSPVATIQTVELGNAPTIYGAGVVPFILTPPPVPISMADLVYALPGPGVYGWWPA